MDNEQVDTPDTEEETGCTHPKVRHITGSRGPLRICTVCNEQVQ